MSYGPRVIGDCHLPISFKYNALRLIRLATKAFRHSISGIGRQPQAGFEAAHYIHIHILVINGS